MHVPTDPNHDASGLRIGLVVSRYHEEITAALRSAAEDTYAAAGGDRGDLVTAVAPGTFELTVIARALAERDDVDGVVALGCVIRGETLHDQHLCRAVAGGLTDIVLATGKPVAFGIVTCQTMHQARARAGGDHGNKGAEAMAAVIETIHAVRALAGGVRDGVGS